MSNERNLGQLPSEPADPEVLEFAIATFFYREITRLGELRLTQAEIEAYIAAPDDGVLFSLAPNGDIILSAKKGKDDA